MRSTEVTGAGGVRLHARETGPIDAPTAVLIHGWSQSWLSWKYQFEGPLAERCRVVAFDLRGHGMSERPAGDASYTDPRAWAGDLAAVIDQLELERPVLVGWSFGGYVACDYIRAHGEEALGGVNFVDWAVMLGDTAEDRALAGSGFNDYFEDAISDDLPTAIAAMRRFVRCCTHEELHPEDAELVLAFNMVVSPEVRRAVAMRGRIDNSELLGTLRAPVLVTQGLEDVVTLPAAADHILGCCRTATKSLYEGVGHSPFLEAPERFNRELAEFVHRASAAQPAVIGHGAGSPPARSNTDETE